MLLCTGLSLATCGKTATAQQPPAADPAPKQTPLTDFVPDDIGMCLQVSDPREMLGTKAFGRIMQSPSFMNWAAQNATKFARMGQHIAGRLEISSLELGEHLFGGEILFGVWPDELNSNAPVAGLLLVEVEDEEILHQVMEVIAGVEQTDAGSTKSPAPAGASVADPPKAATPAKPTTHRRSHAGATYYVREIDYEGTPSQFCVAAIGKLGVMTSSEAIIRRVLELRASAAKGRGSLSKLGAFVEGDQRLPADASVRLFVNPRMWDSEMQAQRNLPDVSLPDALVLDSLLTLWKSSKYWVTSVQMDDRVVIETYFHIDREVIPEPYQGILTSIAGTADFLRHAPPDAVVAYAGHWDVANLSRFLLSQDGLLEQRHMDMLRQFSREIFLGLDIFDDVLAHMGPQIGTFMVRRDPADRPAAVNPPMDRAAANGAQDAADQNQADQAQGEAGRLPFEFVFGAEIRPTPDDAKDFNKALDQGLQTLFRLQANLRQPDGQGNASPATTRVVDGIRVISMPARFGPVSEIAAEMAYTIHDGVLLGGSSSLAVLDAARRNASESLMTSPRLTRLRSEHFDQPSHVLYVDAKSLREMIRTAPNELVSFIMSTRELDRETAQRSVGQLVHLLNLADTILVSSTFDEHGVAISLTLDGSETEELEPSESK
jgi:hypothetical protein